MSRRVPLGVLTIAADGTVVEYLPVGDGAASPGAVAGRKLLGDVFEGGAARHLRERLAAFLEYTVAEPFLATTLEDIAGAGRLQVVFVRSAVPDRIVVTVAPARGRTLPPSAHVRQDPVRGTLHDASGLPVVAANPDLWRGLELMLARDLDEADDDAWHRLGVHWGLAHAVRVETTVQESELKALRELPVEVALEHLSASLALIGLGSFEADLSHRELGMILVDHRDSPFPHLLPAREGGCCAVLAGFHAGLFSYLSGRRLAGLEVACRGRPSGTCRFAVATAERLRRLRHDPSDPLAALARGEGAP